MPSPYARGVPGQLSSVAMHCPLFELSYILVKMCFNRIFTISSLSFFFFCFMILALNYLRYHLIFLKQIEGSSWPWSCGSWIYNYLCNRCLSPPLLLIRTPMIPLRARFTTLCDKICQWFASGRWFSPVSTTNKTDSPRYNWNKTIKPKPIKTNCFGMRLFTYVNVWVSIWL